MVRKMKEKVDLLSYALSIEILTYKAVILSPWETYLRMWAIFEKLLLFLSLIFGWLLSHTLLPCMSSTCLLF